MFFYIKGPFSPIAGGLFCAYFHHGMGIGPIFYLLIVKNFLLNLKYNGILIVHM